MSVFWVAMGRWWTGVTFSVAFATTGCGAAAEWEPITPDQKDYPAVVDVASRRKHPSDGCAEGDEPIKLGIVHAKGEEDETIPAIAKEAASHGGTHYVVEGDKQDGYVATGGYGHIDIRATRATWAVVYRCAP